MVGRPRSSHCGRFFRTPLPLRSATPVWQFVVEVARKSNVQVFATTHSYDCIRGLASLVESKPDLKDEVSIQKVDNSLKEAVCLRGEQIKVAVEQDIEVR